MTSSPDTLPAAEAAIGSWQLNTRQGVAIHVPDRVTSLTTFVLLEQEQWFEAEIDFVHRLIAPDATVLDIGANHGVYTVALGARLGSGRLWAFEPTREPRQRLRRSLEANGLAERVRVVPIGLSDRAREARFTISEHSELNSLHGDGARGETVQLDTLDAFEARELAGRRVDFVKLDAEGEEGAVIDGGTAFFTRHAPIVMFEFRHGTQTHAELGDRFNALGYGIYRLLPEVEVLAPFDPATDEQTFVLNLFAVPSVAAEGLQAAGLLVTRAALTQALAHIDSGREDGTEPGPDAEPVYLEALRCTIAGHTERQRPPAERVALLAAARDDLQAALDRGHESGPEAWALLVHLLHALGQTAAALEIAGELLRQWRDDGPAGPALRPVMPPQRADLDLPRTQPDAAWLRLRLAEFIEMRRAHCSYFAPPETTVLQAIVAQPDRRPEMVRRLVLSQLRRDEPPSPAQLESIARDPACANAGLWRALGAAFAAPASH